MRWIKYMMDVAIFSLFLIIKTEISNSENLALANTCVGCRG